MGTQDADHRLGTLDGAACDILIPHIANHQGQTRPLGELGGIAHQGGDTVIYRKSLVQDLKSGYRRWRRKGQSAWDGMESGR
jgi:hypothetical protein